MQELIQITDVKDLTNILAVKSVKLINVVVRVVEKYAIQNDTREIIVQINK